MTVLFCQGAKGCRNPEADRHADTRPRDAASITRTTSVGVPCARSDAIRTARCNASTSEAVSVSCHVTSCGLRVLVAESLQKVICGCSATLCSQLSPIVLTALRIQVGTQVARVRADIGDGFCSAVRCDRLVGSFKYVYSSAAVASPLHNPNPAAAGSRSERISVTLGRQLYVYPH